jgi:hypothetical protein
MVCFIFSKLLVFVFVLKELVTERARRYNI